MKLHFVSLEIAFASKDFPHPLDPCKMTPFDRQSPAVKISPLFYFNL